MQTKYHRRAYETTNTDEFETLFEDLKVQNKQTNKKNRTSTALKGSYQTFTMALSLIKYDIV